MKIDYLGMLFFFELTCREIVVSYERSFVFRSCYSTAFFYWFHFSASKRAINLSMLGQFSSTQRFSKSYRHKRRPFSLIDGGVLPVLIQVAHVLALTLHKAAACFADNNKGSSWMISTEDLIIAAALRCKPIKSSLNR